MVTEDSTDREHQLRIALETARLGFWKLHIASGVMECSPRCRENFGVAEGEHFTHQKLRALIVPQDQLSMRQAMDLAIRDRTDYRAEYRIIRPDGKFTWIVDTGRALYGHDGAPERMVGVTLDVTEQRLQEEANRTTEERLRFASTAAGVIGTWDWDVTKDLVYANAKFAALYSVDPERASQGAPLSEFVEAVHPEDRERVAQAITHALQTGEEFAEEYRLVQKDNSLCWVYAIGRCHRSETKSEVRFPGVVIEITDRKRASQQIKESQDRLRAIFDGTYEYICLLTPEGVVLEANRASMQFADMTRNDVVGQAFWRTPWFAYTEGAAEVVRKSVMLAANGEPVRYEAQLRNPEGEFSVFDLSFHPIRNARGEIIYIVPEGRKITDLKRAESRNAFLVRLDDCMRRLNDPREIVDTAAPLIAEHLGVDYCIYGEEALEQFRELTSETSEQAKHFVVSDVASDARVANVRGRYENLGVRSLCFAPLHKNGALVGALALHHRSPRNWSPAEIELVQIAANRCWDALERARVTRELESSAQRLRIAQKAGRIGSFEWLIEENHVIWTPELEALFGLAEGEFEGTFQAWSKRVVPDDAERVTAQIEHCLAEKATECSFEFRAVLPDGTMRWLLGHAQFFYTPAGTPHHMVGANIDIDAQKKAEAHLRQQWHNFDTALSNIPDLTYTFDLQGRHTYANRALLSLLQLPLEAVIGKTLLELPYASELAERFEIQIRQVIESKEPLRDQTPFSGPTGETRQYEYIFVPVLTAEGEVEGVAGATRDITERKQAEEQERERDEQIRESARLESLGVMAGGIAHDFNNLLTGILGNACLLADQMEDKDGAIAQQIVIAAERAADLTRQMLAFSGKGRFLVENVDVNAMVRENLMLLRASLSKTVSVALELSPEICLVEADRSQLQQVVMNLLMNASEALGDMPGTVKIRSSITERTVKLFSPFLQTPVLPGRYVLLEVRDNGCGMSAETLRKIFDPFFTTKFTGRGLGLAAVLGIVKGHQGDLEVVTKPGAGTTFRVLLPLSKRQESQAAKQESKILPGSANLTILVVDDEEIVRKVATAALSRAGFRVLVAGEGQEALNLLRDNPEISLVILDLTMPVMTGEQAIPLIKELRPKVPIILSSGFNDVEVFHRFAQAGISGVLQKPYAVSAILSKVNEVLNAISGEAA